MPRTLGIVTSVVCSAFLSSAFASESIETVSDLVLLCDIRLVKTIENHKGSTTTDQSGKVKVSITHERMTDPPYLLGETPALKRMSHSWVKVAGSGKADFSFEFTAPAVNETALTDRTTARTNISDHEFEFGFIDRSLKPEGYVDLVNLNIDRMTGYIHGSVIVNNDTQIGITRFDGSCKKSEQSKRLF